MADETEKNVYTSEGLKRLQDELAERKTTISAEIAERLKEARAQGDLSENSEYDDAKEAQGKNEARIQELVALLKNATVLDDGEISDEFDSASPDLSDKIDKLNFDLVDYSSGKLYFEENV